ncbi:16S rRNA (guanine(527)-N(7))-methyltransferase RsmG [Sediminicoccus sp. KRV36]|nr:16S rRNA (guanine(527)-N(7))-methyltransferase RsmG [Sediminicoccus rosea]UPY39410.1 16S rRNA (guanine(527)-N(7))-methyltransferase RsmG [Sediminicoccus rosea]
MKQPDAPSLDVSRETELRLREYLRLLLSWNAKINLIAAASEEEVWHRHVLDSWQLRPLLPDGALADLGSGGGLPGIVIAIGREQETHLVESDRRKAAFLMEAARSLGLNHVRVHPTRIEAARLPPIQVVTARALAPLRELVTHAARILAPDGVAVLPKGRNAEAELTATAPHWLMQTERFTSRTDALATILRLSEIRPAGV